VCEAKCVSEVITSDIVRSSLKMGTSISLVARLQNRSVLRKGFVAEPEVIGAPYLLFAKIVESQTTLTPHKDWAGP
jgi:hypothetical protein